MSEKLIIKTGSTLPALAEEQGDFEDWIRRELPDADDWRVVNVVAGETLPPPQHCAAAVITGSPAMVSERAPWSEATAAWLRAAHAARVPLLGICYGHQLLADALGGEVGYHPHGPEAGAVEVERLVAAETDPLLGTLPARFAANVIHWQTVLRLPPGAVPLAGNAFEPHQAFRLGSAWGVQFHPEFDQHAMRRYLELLHDRLCAAGRDPQALLAQVRPTPEAAGLLARFAASLVAEAA
ncbi:glutamine amidotransferase [Pseudogulbenkiania subflava]|uniref:GMP synthase (Glutamine-hydrolysing) n=1 Tax=Pseudogulbenkiania subflava DSM 22618 TaxID=1123014 RepID=A0A1Y6CGL2_9NEIS|nr:glutamine amidotransferase [Pseudogulbenkiania subflava]SMF52084.1 GMP synthase (glutamine-hydrolysing) [Pseudogulbenkiania subflava DSM 22618]